MERDGKFYCDECEEELDSYWTDSEDLANSSMLLCEQCDKILTSGKGGALIVPRKEMEERGH